MKNGYLNEQKLDTNKNKIDLSVVIPVYNEEENLSVLCSSLSLVFKKLGVSYEVIFVDDGSFDKSFNILVGLREKDDRIKILKLSRNFGHQIAITAGINYSSGNAVITIDADLQDPPEAIADLYKNYENGYDIVYAVREKREGETFLKLVTAFIFYRIFNKLTSINMPVDTGDFRLMSRKAVNALNEIREKDRFLRGLSSWIGFKQTKVFYKRQKRKRGSSKFSLFKIFAFAFNGITSFSRYPLRLSLIVGIICGLLSFVYLVVSLVYFFQGKTLTGWTSLIVLITFFGSVQLFSIGIMGEYIGRIFDEVKNRPLYLIEDKKGFDDTQK